MQACASNDVCVPAAPQVMDLEMKLSEMQKEVVEGGKRFPASSALRAPHAFPL
jgi:hypothetical protein